MIDTTQGTRNLLLVMRDAIDRKENKRDRELGAMSGAIKGLGNVAETIGKKQKDDQARAAMNSQADQVNIAPDDPVRNDPATLFREINRRQLQAEFDRQQTAKGEQTKTDTAAAFQRDRQLAGEGFERQKELETLRSGNRLAEDAADRTAKSTEEAATLAAKDQREATIGAQTAKLGGDVIEAGGPNPTMLHGLPSPFVGGMGLLPRREATQQDVSKRFDAAAQGGSPMLLPARDRAMQGRAGLPAPVDPLERQKKMAEIAKLNRDAQGDPTETPEARVARLEAEAAARARGTAAGTPAKTPTPPRPSQALADQEAQMMMTLSEFERDDYALLKQKMLEIQGLDAEETARFNGYRERLRAFKPGGGAPPPAAPVRPGMSWQEFNTEK